MASASGQMISAAWSSGTWSYSSTAARYAGYAGSNEYYVTFFQFKTPSFSGVSSSAQFNIYAYKGYGTTANMQYAICTSDANHSKYHGTISAVSDSYQLTSGEVDFTGMTSTDDYQTITVNTTALKSNTTYYLALWSRNNTGISIRGTAYTYGPSTMTLTYQSLYTVTYNANGHGTAPSAQAVAQGSSLTLPTMTASGYRFLGWSTSSTATSGTTGSYTPTGNVTLYAIWIKVHTVTYNANGHGTAPAAVTVDSGGSVELPTMSAAGYRFKGWSTSSAASEGMTGGYTPSGDVTLYAVWIQLFVITFSTNGICEEPEAVTVEARESIELPLLQVDGYRFKGWSEDAEAASGITGEYWPEYSLTLYAVLVEVYTIAYDCGGVCVDPPADQVEFGGMLYLPEPEAEGYRFAGWASYPGADYGTTGEYWPDSSVTLYAVWVVVYTVTFKTNGICAEPDPVTVDAGESIMLPIVEAAGHRFGGWSEDPMAGDGMTGEYYPEGSITLYAVWGSSSSYFYVKQVGEVVRCPIRILYEGRLIRCKGYIIHNGIAVKL